MLFPSPKHWRELEALARKRKVTDWTTLPWTVNQSINQLKL